MYYPEDFTTNNGGQAEPGWERPIEAHQRLLMIWIVPIQVLAHHIQTIVAMR